MRSLLLAFVLGIVPCGGYADEVASPKEALAWFHSLPKMGGMVNKELDPERFKKLTLDNLQAVKEVQIGGHPYLPDGKLGGHLKLADGDYRFLTALPALESVKFPENDLGDDALLHIGRIKTLKKIQLMENKITDNGLKHLAGLSELTHLDMRWNQTLMGDGLQHLTSLPKLTHLDLRACQKLDDSAVPHLMKLEMLLELNLFKTKVSPAGIERIKEALPKCKVVVTQQ